MKKYFEPWEEKIDFGRKWYVVSSMLLLYMIVVAADLMLVAFNIHGWWAALWGACWYIFIFLPYYFLFSYVYKGTAWFEKIFNKITRGSESLFRLLFLCITSAFIIVSGIILTILNIYANIDLLFWSGI